MYETCVQKEKDFACKNQRRKNKYTKSVKAKRAREREELKSQEEDRSAVYTLSMNKNIYFFRCISLGPVNVAVARSQISSR